MQFLRATNLDLSCHINGNHERFWPMTHKVVDNELSYEKLHVPFSCLLKLTNELRYGSYLGSFGFHLAIKTD